MNACVNALAGILVDRDFARLERDTFGRFENSVHESEGVPTYSDASQTAGSVLRVTGGSFNKAHARVSTLKSRFVNRTNTIILESVGFSRVIPRAIPAHDLTGYTINPDIYVCLVLLSALKLTCITFFATGKTASQAGFCYVRGIKICLNYHPVFVFFVWISNGISTGSFEKRKHHKEWLLF